MATFCQNFVILLLWLLPFLHVTNGIYEECKFPTTTFNPEVEIQKFGKPTPFVSTKSIGLNPYTLVDPYRQSALYHEYLLVGPGFAQSSQQASDVFGGYKSPHIEEIQLIVYDGDGVHSWRHEPNLIQHNLGKEYNWALINATGMLPSLTVVNTTFEKTFRFHSDEGDTVAYHLTYPNLFRSVTVVPPMDVLIEFPAKTRTLLTLKSMIDYQTFALLRWRLSPSEPVLWEDIKKGEFPSPTILGSECINILSLVSEEPIGKKDNSTSEVYELDPRFSLCMLQNRFSRLENPCVKDMFLLYQIRGSQNAELKGFSPNELFIIIPMIYDVLNYQGWYNLTEVYCSRPRDPEECADPLDIMLTNDHLLIHTDKGLYVSNHFSGTNTNVSLPYILKPLLKFTPINPCANFDFFNCSQVGAPVIARQAFKRQRLFYTPICQLFQYPVYDDMVMLVIEHVSQSPETSQERDMVTVLYAAQPYEDWNMLFYGKYQYETKDGPIPIKELLGIFFNHHRRHFDITILLNDNGTEQTVRFVMPEPSNDRGKFQGYDELSGLHGNGFLEFKFPQTFHMTHLSVNPEPMDVYFLGNQMWIAEAGGAFVYLSVPVVYDSQIQESYIDSCSFNHPDRSYVCTEKSHTELLVGRIGVTYSPIAVDFKKIIEFKYTMLYNLWPPSYQTYIASLGHFIAGYSGKIMLWYMYDHNELVSEQRRLQNQLQDLSECENTDDPHSSIKCHICERSMERKDAGCKLQDKPKNEARFRMIAFDPVNFEIRDSSTHGPLIPFLVDGDKVVVFEADVPHFEGYKPNYNYLHDINVGNKILCPSYESPATYAEHGGKKGDSNCHEISLSHPLPKCEMYIRHMRRMTIKGHQTFLDGIRRSFYATIVKSFPMKPIPTAIIVIILKDTNHAVVQIDTSPFEHENKFSFTYDFVGQTLYIPEHMSILLTGFAKFEGDGSTCKEHNMTRMVGYATRYYRMGKRIQMGPFKTFLINLSTIQYCRNYRKSLDTISEDCSTKDPITTEYERRRNLTNEIRNRSQKDNEQAIQTVNENWKSSDPDSENDLFQPLKPLEPATYQEIEDSHLIFRTKDKNTLEKYITESGKSGKVSVNGPKHTSLAEWKCPENVIWQIVDGGCHIRLYLSKNPVLKQNGGRISLDKYDSLSFTLKLRSLTPLGKSLIHRPLMSITNSNPAILEVEHKELIGQDPQIMHITLTPTGLAKGVATVTVRPLIISTHCPFADGSFSLLVQVQREEGRKLHVNFPVPVCKPEVDDGQFQRPWKVDLPSCASRAELLKEKSVRRPDDEYGQVFYAELPENYRPPSVRGPEIPVSINVYNVNPVEYNFKDWYTISKQSGDLVQCAGKETKAECSCSENDRLSDDTKFTDCKRMVYIVKRGFRTDINIEYDRLMRDEDQHGEFFSAKTNWSIYLEEVNERTGFTFDSHETEYLKQVNLHLHLHQGQLYYDARTLGVTLHGTGLFHFKVTLGDFESFDTVSGYFTIFCVDNDLNHLQLIVIMLLTITVCMLLVFCGFLAVRSRLCSQLPYQTMNRNKIKLE